MFGLILFSFNNALIFNECLRFQARLRRELIMRTESPHIKDNLAIITVKNANYLKNVRSSQNLNTKGRQSNC